MGARLREAGYRSIRLIEKAGDVGGTWYWNRYPGAMCDVESYVYLPLLEEMGYIPKHKYSFAPEIFEYSKAIARRFDLYDDALFQTGVTELRWDDANGRWIISTDRGDRMTATVRRHGERSAQPAEAPRHPGHQRVQGPHVPHQPVGLRLHRRRLVGRARPASPTSASGSSAPARPRSSASRTSARAPATSTCSSARRRRSTSATTVRPTRSGCSRSSPAGSSGGWTTSTSSSAAATRTRISSQDGWTDIFRNLTGIAAKQASRKLGRRLTPLEKAELMELADFQKMESIRARVESIVARPGDGREAQAVVPPVLQAPVLPRRVPRDVQPAERHAGRHRRQGRRAADRARGRRRRPPLRGRLPDLRHRVRGRHHVHAPRRLRHHRTRRRVALRQVGERSAHVPRPADATASRTASSSASRRPPSPSACRTR